MPYKLSFVLSAVSMLLINKRKEVDTMFMQCFIFLASIVGAIFCKIKGWKYRMYFCLFVLVITIIYILKNLLL